MKITHEIAKLISGGCGSTNVADEEIFNVEKQNEDESQRVARGVILEAGSGPKDPP
ncbi:hypothetical protein [Thalassomonas sp. RHCl1]|uniref:hypothetical protein n=1 Tax=Thalassomonas sp. RHCl1 TaxID=2995320 RepID=UPI00248C0044|nr:hypothetical protein [Thalassomonas sp. RHCl1]